MQIIDYLIQKGIKFEQFDHPPVYTCEEANRLISHLPGSKTKNLFVRDRKGKNHYLVVVSDEKEVDLTSLAKLLDISRLSMGSPERLQNILGIEPGCVSLLALYNDQAKAVQVVIDKEIWDSEALQCHPLVNTSTLVIPISDIKRFIKICGHTANIMKIPVRIKS